MPAGTTKSARRSMEIFEYFAREKRPLSLKEVSIELSCPTSSTAALLKSLVTVGYLEYDKQSKTYLPTMRLVVLSEWITEELFDKTNVLPMMRNLRDLTGLSVLLATRSDLRTQYAHVVHGPDFVPGVAPPGTRRPLAKSGMGLLLLSTLSDRDLEYTVRRINYGQRDPANRVDYEMLRQRASEISRAGYVFSRNLYHANVSVMGALLPTAPFGRTRALGLAGPTDRMEAHFDTNLAILREAVAATR